MGKTFVAKQLKKISTLIDKDRNKLASVVTPAGGNAIPAKREIGKILRRKV